MKAARNIDKKENINKNGVSMRLVLAFFLLLTPFFSAQAGMFDFFKNLGQPQKIETGAIGVSSDAVKNDLPAGESVLGPPPSKSSINLAPKEAPAVTAEGQAPVVTAEGQAPAVTAEGQAPAVTVSRPAPKDYKETETALLQIVQQKVEEKQVDVLSKENGEALIHEVVDLVVKGEILQARPIIQALKDGGANINLETKEGYTALQMALKEKKSSVVEALLDAGAEDANLLKNLLDLKMGSVINHIIKSEVPMDFNEIVDKTEGMNALQKAIDLNMDGVAIQIVQSNYPVKLKHKDVFGFNVFHQAVSLGKESLVKELLKKEPKLINEKTKQGQTALDLIQGNEGFASLTKILKNEGAKSRAENARNYVKQDAPKDPNAALDKKPTPKQLQKQMAEDRKARPQELRIGEVASTKKPEPKKPQAKPEPKAAPKADSKSGKGEPCKRNFLGIKIRSKK